MKVHHILDSLEVGGAERLVVALAMEQKRRGYEVTVHSLHGAGPLEEDLRNAGVRVAAHGGRGLAKLIRSVRAALSAERPDVVHCHNLHATVAGAPAARLSGVRRIISTRHGSSRVAFVKEAKFWAAARYCQWVVAVSQPARGALGSFALSFPQKLTVVANGAILSKGGAGEAPPPRDAGFLIVSVGRLTREKDYPNLVEAFAAARRKIPDARLRIVGEGAERGAVEAAIARHGAGDAVLLAGYQGNIREWLREADVFCLASNAEGLPVALLEAMAAGLPAVVTDAGGMPQVVDEAGCGIVVPRGDAEALAAALVELARDSERRREMGRRARAAFEAKYTIARMADDYEKLYGWRESA
jgi:glycosyltransferase involved in cell wall biosynthesis